MADKKESFIDTYLELDEQGSHIADRESVEIGGRRYRFKINGVVTASPDML